MSFRSMSVVAIAALTVLAALGASRPALSNSGYKAQTRVAGMAVKCIDYRGRRVSTMRVAGLGDVARAWVVNRMPFIIMDRDRLAKLPPKLQLFFYGHECAHHKMGHWMNTTIDSEREADCWSIRQGRDKGLFRRDEVASFAPWFARSRGSRYGHLPGPQRAKFLLKCFDDDTFASVRGVWHTRVADTSSDGDTRK